MSEVKPRHALSDAIDELKQMRDTIAAGGDPFEGLVVRTEELPMETPEAGPDDDGRGEESGTSLPDH
jgi:hypothetical protein